MFGYTIWSLEVPWWTSYDLSGACQSPKIFKCSNEKPLKAEWPIPSAKPTTTATSHWSCYAARAKASAERQAPAGSRTAARATSDPGMWDIKQPKIDEQSMVSISCVIVSPSLFLCFSLLLLLFLSFESVAGWLSIDACDISKGVPNGGLLRCDI